MPGSGMPATNLGHDFRVSLSDFSVLWRGEGFELAVRFLLGLFSPSGQQKKSSIKVVVASPAFEAANLRLQSASFHAPICPNPAITLSRKDWHSRLNRALM
jgi:hypothetical protein